MDERFYASNSKTTRSMQIRKYFQFIDEFHGLLLQLLCPSPHVALYITWLSRSLKYSSITNYLSALNFSLKSEGVPLIDYSAHQVRKVLGGIKRTLGCTVKRAAPLLPKELITMFSYMSDIDWLLSASELAFQVPSPGGTFKPLD